MTDWKNDYLKEVKLSKLINLFTKNLVKEGFSRDDIDFLSMSYNDNCMTIKFCVGKMEETYEYTVLNNEVMKVNAGSQNVKDSNLTKDLKIMMSKKFGFNYTKDWLI